jgi:hypothetical protein
MRGSLGTFTDSHRGVERENPVAQSFMVKGMRGDAEAILALASPHLKLCRA